MDRHEIANALIHQHAQFVNTVRAIPEQEVVRSNHGKWSPAQQLDHIVRSVSPVRMAFSLPTIALRIKFGTSNRSSRTYDALVERYHEKLGAGGKASGPYLPGTTTSVNDNAQKLLYLVQSLCRKIEGLTESQLDRFILPHPLLGKLTLREMLYFTLYHVQHHHAQIPRNNVA